jgi:hypothetical protein
MSSTWICRTLARPTPTDPAARLVLLILADVVTDATGHGSFEVSLDHLTRTAAIQPEAVKTVLHNLRDQGLIAVHPRTFTPDATHVAGELY